MPFERVFTDTPWESQVGYCRAVRAGHLIFVTGTAPVGADGKVVGPGDGYLQARRCFEIISESLERLGASMTQVVRTRMFVTDISQWEAYGRAHREYLGQSPPCTSMVEVQALIDPEMLIEIEADAVILPD